MPSEGWLEVLFNDKPGSYDDNSGHILLQAVALWEPYDMGQVEVLERLWGAQDCLTTIHDAYGPNPLIATDVEAFLGGIPACAATLFEGADGLVSIWNNCVANESKHEVCDQLAPIHR